MPCTRRLSLLIGRAASLCRQWPNFGEFTKDEARRSGRQDAGRITIIPDLVRMQTVTSVQQPCSNPGKYPERLRNASRQRISTFAGILQSPEIPSKLSCCLHSAEDASSIGHRPLRNYLQNAVFWCSLFLPRLLVCSNRAATRSRTLPGDGASGHSILNVCPPYP